MVACTSAATKALPALKVCEGPSYGMAFWKIPVGGTGPPTGKFAAPCATLLGTRTQALLGGMWVKSRLPSGRRRCGWDLDLYLTLAAVAGGPLSGESRSLDVRRWCSGRTREVPRVPPVRVISSQVWQVMSKERGQAYDGGGCCSGEFSGGATCTPMLRQVPMIFLHSE